MLKKMRDRLFPVETFETSWTWTFQGDGWHSVFHIFSASSMENACRTCASSSGAIQAAANALHQKLCKACQTLRPFPLFQLAK